MTLSNNDWFLHQHLATTLDERLPAIKAVPQQIILAGADGNHSHTLLHARYPQAQFTEYDGRADYLQAALAQRKQQQSLWQKLSGKLPPQQASHRLPENETADMLWANLSLVAQPDPVAVFENWAAALKPDGLLFFTHFGPDSLKEVLAYWRAHGIEVAAPLLPDMHDIGDMLFHHGFYDPVMDMEKRTLQYASAAGFVADMRVCGLWASLQLADEAAAEAALQQGWASGALRDITLELVYGHALKKLKLPENAALVQFYPQRRV